jgi:hypothetical protein
MGGLIARCYLQNICINGIKKPDGRVDEKNNIDLELPGDCLVDKVFTYGTPHNGIDILGMNVLDLGPLDPFHTRNFNRDNMRIYLNLSSDDERVDSLDGKFPVDRFFSLVGTNYSDYRAFFNLSRKGTGPMSDGLVMIKNAAVKNSPKAFAYRSHSGEYGIVNSEEGYQNLKRFLFGQYRVDVKLQVDEITLPPDIQEMLDKKKKIRASYHIETTAQVRGADYFLNERRYDQKSAIFKSFHELIREKKPVYLFTGYLDKRAKTTHSKGRALSFAIRVSVKVPLYEVDNKFWFDSHFEGGDIINKTVIFYVPVSIKKTNVQYSILGEPSRRRNCKPKKLDDSGYEISIPLGFKKGQTKIPRPGFRGKLVLRVYSWN